MYRRTVIKPEPAALGFKKARYQKEFKSNLMKISNGPINPELTTEYFQWLGHKIKVENANYSYWILAKVLFMKEFFWIVPNDDNRAADGIRLRERFAMNIGGAESHDILEGPCRVLEMLVALAERFEDQLAGLTGPDHTARRFWEMMRNCGLKLYSDQWFFKNLGDDDDFPTGQAGMLVEQKINRVLERTYKPNGEGGLFPLKNTCKNQKRVEIWYQMNSYIHENYNIMDAEM